MKTLEKSLGTSVINSPLSPLPLNISHGGRGYWVVYYTSPKYILLMLAWQLWGPLLNFIIKLSVQTFQPLTVIYRRGNFIYHHWGCASIYRPLSYTFRSLILNMSILFFFCISFIKFVGIKSIYCCMFFHIYYTFNHYFTTSSFLRLEPVPSSYVF